MSNVTIPGLSTQLTSVDRSADLLEVSDTSDSGNSKKSSVNNLLDLTSHPVGVDDSQTLTLKTLTAPTISSPVLSGSVTGTYTLAGTPTFPSAVVTLTGSQTLTNKVLTAPTISTPTITNPTVTVDTISEFTGANGVTIDGLNIKDSKLNTSNSVVASNITDSAITFSKLDSTVSWWQELGRTTLSVAGDTITVSSFAGRRYLSIVVSTLATGGTQSPLIAFNGDSGNNYVSRASDNGGADATSVSRANIPPVSAAGAYPMLVLLELVNISAQEKIGVMKSSEQNTAGAANAPVRREGIFKWANTSAQVTTVTITNTGTGDFAIGSEVVILGHD